VTREALYILRTKGGGEADKDKGGLAYRTRRSAVRGRAQSSVTCGARLRGYACWPLALHQSPLSSGFALAQTAESDLDNLPCYDRSPCLANSLPNYCCDARTRARPNRVCVERTKLIVENFPHFFGPK